MGTRSVILLPPKPGIHLSLQLTRKESRAGEVIHLSLQLTPKESRAGEDKLINITSHLHLRMNEFIRSFLRKVF